MYSRNKSQEEIAYEATVVWSCTNEGCTCWMRDNFAFEVAPTCWKCNSPMISSTKSLPLLVNNNQDIKEKKKSVTIANGGN
ncbi:hypothetical protein D3C73_1448190 [compost metagenome]